MKILEVISIAKQEFDIKTFLVDMFLFIGIVISGTFLLAFILYFKNF